MIPAVAHVFERKREDRNIPRNMDMRDIAVVNWLTWLVTKRTHQEYHDKQEVFTTTKIDSGCMIIWQSFTMPPDVHVEKR